MGLLDSVLGSAIGALGQQGGNGGGAGALLQVVMGMMNNGQAGGGAGGLGGLLQQLQQAGLGEAVQSWVGTGQNLPVSGEQLHAALGGDAISQMAQKVGLSPGDLSGQLAQLLPQVVDKLTPHGQVPEAGTDLGGLLGGLLGSLGQPR